MATRPRAVVWSRTAQRGLDEVLAYVSRESLDGAQRIARGALDSADSLASLSERGRIVLGETRVTVLAFLYGARDFERWLRGDS